MSGLWQIIVPEATTNLCTNPSFEEATTGWSASGTNTIAQSSVQQWRGRYSLLITYQNTADALATFASPAFSTSNSYTCTLWLYVPPDWDGGDIAIDDGGTFAGATITEKTIWTAGNPTGEWYRLETLMALAADATGNVVLYTTSPPTAGRTLYIDGVQIENKTYATTYVDGDEPGGRWAQAKHLSQSSRSAQERGGGRVRSLDDYNVYVRSHLGTGMADVQQRHRPTLQQDGSAFVGSTVLSRVMQFDIDIAGSSQVDMHSKKKAFFDLIKPNRVKGDQGFTLRYVGGDSNRVVEIRKCRYDGGMSGGTQRGFTFNTLLRLIAEDPAFYSLGDSYIDLNNADSIGPGGLFAWHDGTFKTFGPPTNGGIVYAIMIQSNGDIWVGGDFNDWDGAGSSLDNLAVWDVSAQSWVRPGAIAPNGIVRAFVEDNDGNVWMGGEFTNLGTRVAKWNGSTWDTGANINGTVHAMGVSHLNRIWIGGAFTTSDVGTCRRIAANAGGSTNNFTELNNGLNGTVYAIHVSRNQVYVGGAFTADGTGAGTYRRIASNNQIGSSGWTEIGGGVDNNQVYAIHLARNGLLYIGGDFTGVANETPTLSSDRFAFWNGASWIAVDDGPSSTVYALEELTGGSILVGHAGTAASYNGRVGLSVWDGVRMSAHRLQGFTPRQIIVSGEDLYFGVAAAANASVPGQTAVTNSGTTVAFPLVKFKIIDMDAVGADGMVYLCGNDTTEDYILTAISYNNIPDTDVVTIDFDPDDPKFESALRLDLDDELIEGSNFSGIHLLPGSNTVALHVRAPGAASVDYAYMLWRPRHWSLDGEAD